MPRHGVARAAHQQREAVVEPRLDLARRQRPRPRRGELERQRRAVEPRAHRDDRRVGLLVERQVGLQLRGPLEEQRPRVLRRQRRRAATRLVGQPERLAAGGDDRHLRARPQAVGHLGGRVEHVLAVVEAQQQPPPRELGAQRGRLAARRVDEHAGRLRHRAADLLRVRERPELDPPHAVGPAAGLLSRRAGPSSRVLPLPPGPAIVSSRAAGHAGVQVGELRLAPDERRRPAREVVRRRVERARRRPVLEREHPQRRREVPQPVQPEVVQLRAVRRGRRGDERLPGVGDLAQPPRAGHARPGEPLARLAGVDREPGLGSPRRAATAAASASATAGKAVTPASLARNVAKVTHRILTDIGHLAARSWPGGRCSSRRGAGS